MIKRKFKFKLTKKDLTEHTNIITDKELKESKKVKKFIINEKPKIITYSNKRRDSLNDTVRELIYTQDHDYIDRYLFLEDEELIFESTYYGGSPDPLYHNTDEVTVKSVQYNIIKKLEFFNLIHKVFNLQKIVLQDNMSLYQISKTQIKTFVNIINLLKRCVKDYFSYNVLKTKFTAASGYCDCCDSKQTHFRTFYNDEKICKQCYHKIRQYIKKRFFCPECKEYMTNSHKCFKKSMSTVKQKKAVFNEMFKEINALHDKYNLPVKYSYCITCYKSQGSTYQNVIIDFENMYDCNRHCVDNLTRCMYVGTSRTQNKLWFLNYRHT